MFFVNAALNDISIGTAGLVALLGYAVVFVGLIALMAVIMIVGKIMVAKKTAPAAAPADAAVEQTQLGVELPLPLRLPRPRLFPHLPPAPPENASSITSATAKPPCSWPSSPTSSASLSIPCASNR